MERECVYKEGMTVSVWGFHHWTQGEVVWTCSLLYLWWWSNRPWKALLLNYPTGISPLIHRKRGTERDDGWMRKVMSGRRREGKGWWEGGKERERCLSSGKGCVKKCFLLRLRVVIDRTCTHAWLRVISQWHIPTDALIFFSFHLTLKCTSMPVYALIRHAYSTCNTSHKHAQIQAHTQKMHPFFDSIQTTEIPKNMLSFNCNSSPVCRR